MTLVVESKNFWRCSPYAKRLAPGTKVGVVHTSAARTVECNTCGNTGSLIVDEEDGHWGWGRCPNCDKRYLIDFV